MCEMLLECYWKNKFGQNYVLILSENDIPDNGVLIFKITNYKVRTIISDAGGLLRVWTILKELRRLKRHTRADLSLERTIDETVIVKNWTRC